jgi:glycosyltransferase involved in cell wall biosynthesis
MARATSLCIDTRPLATGHRLRGIGTYVSALVEHLGRGDTHGIELRYVWPAECTADLEDLPSVLREPAARLDVGSDVAAQLAAAGCRVYHATTLEGLAPSRAYATVATIYDLIPVRAPRWRQIARRPHAYVAYRRQLRRLAAADHLIAISEATKRDACALLGVAPARVSVVPLAADPARAYVPTHQELAAAEAELGLEHPYFLGVASSDPHKNIPRMLEAFARFRARSAQGATYQLYIVGTWMGHEQRHIHNRIARLGLNGAVQHLTEVPTRLMASLYHGAEALVYPSLIEGFGLPVLEAMMCETPVITSDRSSLPEAAGDAALLVDPEHVEALAAALVRLASDPHLRSDLIARGREQCRRFSWERVAAETLAVYRQVAGERIDDETSQAGSSLLGHGAAARPTSGEMESRGMDQT